jgi:hypothetical protein
VPRRSRRYVSWFVAPARQAKERQLKQPWIGADAPRSGQSRGFEPEGECGGHVVSPQRRTELPGDDGPRQVVQHRRDIEPAPADHLEVGEVGSRTPSFRGHRQRPPRDPLTIVLSSGNQAPSPSTPTSPSTRRSPRSSPGGPRRRGDYTVTPFQLTTQDDIGWRVATITGRPDLQRLQTGSAEPRDSPRGRAACRR